MLWTDKDASHSVQVTLKNQDIIIILFWADIDVNKSGNVLFQEVVDNDVLERIIYDIITAYPILISFRAQ